MAVGEETRGSFAVVLRSMRERAGLTQEGLAERAGLTPHAVSALERGTRTRPYPHTVRSLAAALEASEDGLARLIEAVPSRRNAAAASEALSSGTSAAPFPVGITTPATTLFGRQHDLEAAGALVRSGHRFLTITGPGGVGKTRLAAALSEELRADHPDGVVQVSLAPVADAGEVVPLVGRVLGLSGTDAPDALDVLRAHLEPLRLLLMLDNFEHLLSASGAVARLVAGCPSLTVLVSSRAPLRVRGETEYPLAPLELPPLAARSEAELAASAAGALVLDRARAVAPHLQTGAADIAALSALCHRLAGLPLAIELACARLRVLTPAALVDRLEQVAASAGARDLPERQRTMRATLDWSYGLLTPDQQRLFRLLGTFRGGATLEAIEQVAAGVLEPDSVLNLLEELVEHSLVVVRGPVAGALRYEQLEPVAQYARGLLVGEEAEDAGRAHAEVFLALAEQASVGYEHADQVAWLNRVEADEANILLAIDRSLDGGSTSVAGRITWAMWLYWWLRGQVTLGRRRAEQCLPVVPLELRGRVHLTGATMSYAGGELEAATGHWSEAYRLALEASDAEVLCKAASGMGLAALGAGDLETAEARFTEGLQHGAEAGQSGVWLRSLTHVWLGTVLLLTGRSDAAVEEIQRGLELASSRGDRLSTYIGLYNLSQAAIAAGDHALARDHLDEGIRLSDQTRDLANLAYFLEALAVVESADGSHERVATLLGAARSLRETVGASVYAYYQPDEELGRAAEARARAALGVDDFDDAVDLGRAFDGPQAVRFALGGRVPA